MSAKFRTTFSPEDLHRLANAPNRIYCLDERLGEYEPVLTGHHQAVEELGGSSSFKRRTGEVEEPIDSGLGSEIQDEVCNSLERPKLILPGDTENHDSGFNEEMDTDEDEKDCCSTVRSPTPPQQTAPTVEKPQPRRPKKNHITVIPRSVSPQNIVTVRTTPKEKPRPETVAQEFQIVKPEKLRQERTEDQSDLQKYIQFFIPNKDGDT